MFLYLLFLIINRSVLYWNLLIRWRKKSETKICNWRYIKAFFILLKFIKRGNFIRCSKANLSAIRIWRFDFNRWKEIIPQLKIIITTRGLFEKHQMDIGSMCLYRTRYENNEKCRRSPHQIKLNWEIHEFLYCVYFDIVISFVVYSEYNEFNLDVWWGQ